MTRLSLELKSGNAYVVINSDLNMCKIICSQSGVKNLFIGILNNYFFLLIVI